MGKQALAGRAASGALATSTRRPGAWRLQVVKDLLADLRTATISGRRFTIEKVVRILEEEMVAAALDLSELQRRGLAKALADLRNEQKRSSPRVEAVVVRVETMLWTLASF